MTHLCNFSFDLHHKVACYDHLPLTGGYLPYFWSLFGATFPGFIAVGSNDVTAQWGISPLLSFWHLFGSLDVWLLNIGSYVLQNTFSSASALQKTEGLVLQKLRWDIEKCSGNKWFITTGENAFAVVYYLVRRYFCSTRLSSWFVLGGFWRFGVLFVVGFFSILIKAKSCTLPGFLVAGSVYIGSRSSTGSDGGIYPLIHLFCR